VLVVLLSVAAVHSVNGLSSGAPRDACVALTPQHNGNQPQITPSPHIVDLSDFNITEDEDGNITIYYTPDTMYASKFCHVLMLHPLHWLSCVVTLVATGEGMFSDVFRGFLLQGRMYADDTVVGTFMPPPQGALYRLSSCVRNDVSSTILLVVVFHHDNVGLSDSQQWSW